MPVPASSSPPVPEGPLAALAADAEVAAAAEEARASVDRLLRHRVVRRRRPEVTAESSLRGARASVALDGTEVGLEELRDALRAGRPVAPDGERRARLSGALRVHAGLGPLVAVSRAAPRQAWARLHLLAAAGLVDDDDLGRPRVAAGAEDPLGLGPPPPPPQVAARLDALVDLLPATRRVPAVVVAAVVHAELLVLRPFARASGVVARAAARLVLVERGLDPGAVAVPEVGHVERSGEYAAAARAWAAGEEGAAQAWVVHCARATGLGAREGVAVCEAVQRGAAS